MCVWTFGRDTSPRVTRKLKHNAYTFFFFAIPPAVLEMKCSLCLSRKTVSTQQSFPLVVVYTPGLGTFPLASFVAIIFHSAGEMSVQTHAYDRK